jgi:hypothetical protein
LVPQAPQLSGLFIVLTHAPSQQKRPVVHVTPHPPPLELPPDVEPPLDALPPELEPPEVLPPPELLDEPEAPLPEPLDPEEPPLEEPPLDEDEEVPVSPPGPSREASGEPPEVNVDPPHAAPMTATVKNAEACESVCFMG